MADSLEEIANESNSNPDNLETKVNNSKKGFFGRLVDKVLSYGRLAFDFTVGAAATLFSYSLIGPTALIAVGISIAGDLIINYRKGCSTPSRMLRDSMLQAAFWSIPGYHAFKWMNKVIDVSTLAGKVTRAFAQLGVLYHAIGIPAYFTGYTLRNKSPEGFTKFMKDFYWKNYWRSLAYFGVPNMLTAYYLPPYTHYPISLGTRTFGRAMIFGDVLKKYDFYKNERIPLKKNLYFPISSSYIPI